MKMPSGVTIFGQVSEKPLLSTMGHPGIAGAGVPVIVTAYCLRTCRGNKEQG